MSIRAKFFVQSITTSKSWSGPGLMGTVLLQPVTDGSEENRKFYEATPGGKIELGTVNSEALKQFNIGDEFYIDFTPARKEN